MPSPITHAGVRFPGLALLPAGVERYTVQGCGSLCIDLQSADRLEIVDPEGQQVCELLVFDTTGRCDPGFIGASANHHAQGIRRLLQNPSATTLVQELRAKGLQPAQLNVITALGDTHLAGTSTEFIANQQVHCLIAAPGKPMQVDAQNPPTALTIWIHRANVPVEPQRTALPAPLADPVDDFRIERCTARAYLIKAGDYLQVIDVEGRECSDFQCFEARQLESGIETALDATATRTLNAAAYPGPGLFSKFYNHNLQPMVEVIRDTCGRHDSFGLACTAKYYDDAGYPRHINCSDNFNSALAPYGIAPRGGWMAMNLFFNTHFDDTHQMLSDEPWSRPGDYVLMRALQDLVCVSSACPDDIDPANGWNPTDIHIRVYDQKKVFSKAIAYRMTTDAQTQLTKPTAFHSRTSALTRNFTEVNGYWLADHYTHHGVIAEYWACRERVAVADLSSLRKYEVLGPDAERLLQTCVTRNVRKLAIGQVVYTAMCYDTGGMIDDGTVFRLGADNFRWVGGSDESGLWLREQAQRLQLRAWVKTSTEQLCNLQVQGPLSRRILDNIIWTRPDQASIDELQWFRFSIARLGDMNGVPLIVSRTGFTGELGYEIFCHPDDGGEVWDALFAAGTEVNITPLGMHALDMLRIEAGLVLAGHEFDDQTDPFEAGIGFTVPLKSNNEDFIGRDALQHRKVQPQRKLVGLELQGEEIAAHGECVRLGRQQVGIITSGTRSPVLAKNIALCRMAIEHSTPGTQVEVGKLDGHQKRLPATVVRFPFYDPDKTRVRA